MPQDLNELYERGNELYEQGDYREAERLFSELINKRPGYADVKNKLGLISHDRGRLKEASEHFQDAINENTDYTEAYINLIVTLNDMGETDRAVDVSERLKILSPSKPGQLDPYAAGKLANEHFKLGNIYLEFNRYNDAHIEFRKALSLKPGLPDVMTKLGFALSESGRYDEAVSALTKAKDANPLYGPARVQLGLTYFKHGHTGLAFEEWEQAATDIPGLKEAETLLRLFRKSEHSS